MKARDVKKDKVQFASSECGAPHGDCSSTWKGSCDREAGHSGSHHCDKCNGVF